jgi:hypothetical protein
MTARRTGAPPRVMGVARFQRLFRATASLDVDKEDLRRFDDFVHRKLYDLLVRAQAVAKANIRDVIEPHDLPITKGLQQCIQEFGSLDEEIGVKSILERLATLPRLDMATSAETEAELPQIAGGLSVAVARSFRIIEPELKNPQTTHWERAFRLFDLLL